MNDLVHLFKGKYNDPHVIVSSDWNRADTDIAFQDFPFLQEIHTLPTRGDDTLDTAFTNMSRSITEVNVGPPLIPNSGRPGRQSDHNVVYIQFKLERKRNFKWHRYSYWKYTPEGDAAFGQWIIDHDWLKITGDPSEMTEALGKTLDRVMEAFFPLVSRRLQSDEDPWINTYLEKMTLRSKMIFKLQGRSASWKKG